MDVLKNKNVLYIDNADEFAHNFLPLLEVFVNKIFHSTTITQAYEILYSQKINIIIGEIKIGIENIFDFIESIRKDNIKIPIIILSNYKNEEFLFRAIPLKLTAYLLKPINYKELIEALTKCTLFFDSPNYLFLKNGYCFDSTNRMLYTNEGQKVSLNKKETLFILLLLANENKIVTRSMMAEHIWGLDEVSNQAIVNFIMRFRHKVGKKFLKTIADEGYRLG